MSPGYHEPEKERHIVDQRAPERKHCSSSHFFVSNALLLVAEHFLKGRVIRFAGHVALLKTRSPYILLAPIFIALLTTFRLDIGLLHII